MSNKPTKKTPVLSLKNITKDYVMGDETLHILKNISLNIYAGELVSIVGPSGSGKSTLLHIMGLLDRQTSGELFLAGEDATSLTEDKAAKLRNRYIGFIFQQFNLLNRTSALENVLLPTLYNDTPDEEERVKAVKLLTDLGLGERIHNKPNQLSGGQQQRVAIARALINDPKIIFADEPTGNLDQKNGHEVLSIIKDLHKQGRTIVIVTHDMELASVAKRRIRILDGQIVEDKQL